MEESPRASVNPSNLFMTDEQTKLLSLIDGHHAAMRAQVERPDTRIQYLTESGEWLHQYGGCTPLCNVSGPQVCRWRRLAPAPKIFDLDQSDFIGPNRVTHLRFKNSDGIILEGFKTTRDLVLSHGHNFDYCELRMLCECSRDFGATFGPCSNEST